MQNRFTSNVSLVWKHSRAFRYLAVVFGLALLVLVLVIVLDQRERVFDRPPGPSWHRW